MLDGTQRDRSSTEEEMVMSLWLETVLKVVVMGATLCSGIIVARYDVPIGDEGHEGGRGTRQSQQELDRAA